MAKPKPIRKPLHIHDIPIGAKANFLSTCYLYGKSMRWIIIALMRNAKVVIPYLIKLENQRKKERETGSKITVTADNDTGYASGQTSKRPTAPQIVDDEE